jgi:hypothetical protein
MLQGETMGLGVGHGNVDLRCLMRTLAKAGEQVSSDPEEVEARLRGVISDAHGSLGLGYLGLDANVSEDLRVEVEEGCAARGATFEEPLVRGSIRIGILSASPRGPGAALSEDQSLGLRAVAGCCALIVDAAQARLLAATRAAQSGAVQLASEAMGNILDEDRLHNTVLVLTLELLDACGGAVLVGGEVVASLGLDGGVLLGLQWANTVGSESWPRRLGDLHASGAPVGADGALFLFRRHREFDRSECTSLKLVARQLARSREHSLLLAANEKTTLDAILALSAALETRDGTTGEHIRRTQILAEKVARAMGLPPERVKDTRYAAVLHDVGKIGVPDALLSKPGRLDEREWEIMRRHPEIGADILGKIGGFERIARTALTHHERVDGKGYPVGLTGQEIPVEARIISAVDAFDAMTNDRPYRAAMAVEDALAELVRGAGSQFDSGVVEVLIATVRERRTGEDG